MLGGPQARQDAADLSGFSTVHISTLMRADLVKQTLKMLRSVGLEAEQVTAQPDEQVTTVASEWLPIEKLPSPTSMAIAEGARGVTGAHIALWKRCVADEKPLLILEDGLLLVQKIAKVVAHLVATVERTVAADERTLVLYLGGDLDADAFSEHWLPTDLSQPDGQRVLLREVSRVHGSHAYVIWPLAARRLLASLPLTVPVDVLIARNIFQDRVRALICQPVLSVSRTQAYVQLKRFLVTFQPRVAVRDKPSELYGKVETAKATGEVLGALGYSEDKNWIQIGEKQWVMLHHPKHGALLEPLPEDDDDGDAA